VFGISQRGEEFSVSGVEVPEKLQNDFLSVLHADQKVNHDVHVSEEKLVIGGETVLVFHIAENHRTRKPVYLNGDIRRTFLRKGGGDYKAQMQDIERMLRDATADRWDSQPFERILLKEAFHPGSLHWYRNRFHQVNTGFDPNNPTRSSSIIGVTCCDKGNVSSPHGPPSCFSGRSWPFINSSPGRRWMSSSWAMQPMNPCPKHGGSIAHL
jgi:hypothetical protein